MSNNAVNKAPAEAFKVGENMSQSLIMHIAENGGSPGDIVYSLCQLALGVVTELACVITARNEDVHNKIRQAFQEGDIHTVKELSKDMDPHKDITSEAKLFAALLINKASPDYNQKDCSSDSEMGPHVFWETINAFEKLTGYAPDKYLAPAITQAGRVVGQMGADVLNAWIERQRLDGKTDSSSLN